MEQTPPVTVRGGPPEGPGDGAHSRTAHVVVLLAVAAAVVLGVVVGRQDPLPGPERAPQPVGGDLSVVASGVSVSRGGVLVVPVVLQDRGSGLTVEHAQAYAAPVREDPSTSPPRVVPPGESRRFVVLLAPDCRFLTPETGLSFSASLLLRVRHAGGSEQLVLELDPAVAAVVRRLCRR